MKEGLKGFRDIGGDKEGASAKAGYCVRVVKGYAKDDQTFGGGTGI